MDWAKSGARKYAGLSQGRLDYDEFLSAAYEGLVIAARKFEPERGWTFKTYAMNWTESKMQRALMEKKRQQGWSWNHSSKERLAGKKGMKQHAHLQQFPVGDDGHELEIASHAYEEDFVSTLEAERRKAKVLSLTRNGRERQIMEKLLSGQNYTQIGVSIGVSWQRIHQIVKPMLKRIQLEIQEGVERSDASDTRTMVTESGC